MLDILSFNTRRFSSQSKLDQVRGFFDEINPDIILVQEAPINKMHFLLSQQYEAFFNISSDSLDNIGIIMMVHKKYKVYDLIIGEEGRSIGVKLNDAQIWNIYPQSGSRSERENFFNELLVQNMASWFGTTSKIILGGDVNCTSRLIDSEHHQLQHYQESFVQFMKMFSLKDEYVTLHGEINPPHFSRITEDSKTRIDVIASNTSQCEEIEYIESGIRNIDHRAVLAKYDINLQQKTKAKWLSKKNNSWVFPKELEEDEDFDIGLEIIVGNLAQKDKREDWNEIKRLVKVIAKERINEKRRQERGLKEFLTKWLQDKMNEIIKGRDEWEEYNQVKRQLANMREEKSKKSIIQLRLKNVQDHTWDINKREQMKKKSGVKNMMKLRVDNVTYEGTDEIIKGLEKKLAKDMGDSDEEEENERNMEFFTEVIKKFRGTEEEVEKLEKRIEEEDLEECLKEVDLDSSPGEDGITYRGIKKLCENTKIREIFIGAINESIEKDDWGEMKGKVNLILLNKKKNTDDYNGKRKISKFNKDMNLVGKMWTKRFMEIILPQTLPATQFCCSKENGITRENFISRSLVNSLRNEGAEEKDGTLVAIDFKGAFRSTSHKWIKRVFDKMEIPDQFKRWFWMFYKNLKLKVIVNGHESEDIPVKRGVCEGSPQSMPAFAAIVGPVLERLDKEMEGISDTAGKKVKVLSFADDTEVFLKNPEEIHKLEEVIEKFEKVSGLEMHRDPSKDKCQALTFGSHRDYKDWPAWVSIKEEIKVVGIHYTNKREKSVEKLNSEKVYEKVKRKIVESRGNSGNILQKAYYINTHVLSKVWYAAQSVELDEDILKKIDKECRAWIYRGEGEAPVNEVNYRSFSKGGVGLQSAQYKARALLYKNSLKINNDDNYVSQDQLTRLRLEGFKTSKEIYNFLMKTKLERGGELIPSRAEKNEIWVRWNTSRSNLEKIRSITSDEKEFAW